MTKEEPNPQVEGMEGMTRVPAASGIERITADELCLKKHLIINTEMYPKLKH